MKQIATHPSDPTKIYQQSKSKCPSNQKTTNLQRYQHAQALCAFLTSILNETQFEVGPGFQYTIISKIEERRGTIVLSEIGVGIGSTRTSKPVLTKVGKEGFPFFCACASDQGEVGVEGKLRDRVSVWVTEQEEVLPSKEKGEGELEVCRE